MASCSSIIRVALASRGYVAVSAEEMEQQDELVRNFSIKSGSARALLESLDANRSSGQFDKISCLVWELQRLAVLSDKMQEEGIALNQDMVQLHEIEEKRLDALESTLQAKEAVLRQAAEELALYEEALDLVEEAQAPQAASTDEPSASSWTDDPKSFKTDGEIVKSQLEGQQERKLVAWVDSGSQVLAEESLLEPSTSTAPRQTWDQFQQNEELFGVRSTYSEDLYSTALDVSKVPQSVREQADRIAREIDPPGRRVGSSRGDDGNEDVDEEGKFSAVSRAEQVQPALLPAPEACAPQQENQQLPADYLASLSANRPPPPSIPSGRAPARQEEAEKPGLEPFLPITPEQIAEEGGSGTSSHPEDRPWDQPPLDS
ncbi:unnamed protein product [Polarella glacialis]|uniref:LsmAD domain-containing protein n=3 Tax=Polarella glacialis TaxID=89957 RepID=A0A813I4M4_POLGL|nr:unnamed protein product [Polarella glacialis]